MSDHLDYDLISSSDDDEMAELNLQSAPTPSPPTPTAMDICLPERISPLPPTPEPHSELFKPVSPPPMPVASSPNKIIKPTPRSIVQVAPSRVHPAKIPLVSAKDYKSRDKRISTSLSKPSKISKSPVSMPKRSKSPVSRPKQSNSLVSRPIKKSSSHSGKPSTTMDAPQTPEASTSQPKTLAPTFQQTSHDNSYSRDFYQQRRRLYVAARHSHSFAVLCMRSDGHTITNGYVYYAVDGPICPQLLLEQIYEMRVNFLVCTDAATKSSWDEVLGNLSSFHPARQLQTVVLRQDLSKPLGRCVFCSREYCHRWIAVTGGISKYLHMAMEPIPHRS